MSRKYVFPGLNPPFSSVKLERQFLPQNSRSKAEIGRLLKPLIQKIKFLPWSDPKEVKGLSDEFEVVVTKRGDLDDITLKIEILPDAEANQEALLRELRDQLRLKTNLGYNIEVHPYQSLPRYEVKAKRFKDLRKHG